MAAIAFETDAEQADVSLGHSDLAKLIVADIEWRVGWVVPWRFCPGQAHCGCHQGLAWLSKPGRPSPDPSAWQDSCEAQLQGCQASGEAHAWTLASIKKTGKPGLRHTLDSPMGTSHGSERGADFGRPALHGMQRCGCI